MNLGKQYNDSVAIINLSRNLHKMILRKAVVRRREVLSSNIMITTSSVIPTLMRYEEIDQDGDNLISISRDNDFKRPTHIKSF